MKRLFLFFLTASALSAAALIRPAAAQGEDSVAAVVADSSVPLIAVQMVAADRLRKVRNDEYDALRQALEEIMSQTLADRESRARGVTPQELLRTEVDAKAPAPTDAEKRAFYEQNKARMDPKPYEELAPMLDDYLRQQALSARRAAFMRDLKAKYGVRLNIEPPRAEVDSSTDPSRGPKDAPVTLIEFSDFQCPFCAKAEDTMRKVEALYGKSLRVVFRDYPLTIHKDAPRAAEAADCADEQRKFWPYHDLLYANQDKLSDEGLKDLAAQAGLKKEPFAQCLASGKYAAEWRQDAADGKRVGVNGTPTFFVNGRILFGNVPYETLVQAIDDELLRLGKPLPGAGKRK